MSKCAGDYGNHNDKTCGTWHEQFDQNPHMMDKLPEPFLLRPDDWDDLAEEVRQAIDLFYKILDPLRRKAQEVKEQIRNDLMQLDYKLDDYSRSITVEDLRNMLTNNDYLKQRGIEITDAGSVTDTDLKSYIDNYYDDMVDPRY